MTDRTDPSPTDPRLTFSEPSPSADTDAFEERLRSALAPNLQLVRQIGAGGMARVFLAREPVLKRLVAVKVLSAELAAQDDARRRFEREAQAVAGLSHPNIVSVHSVGEMTDGTPYFVMQHVSGRSMAARLDDEGPLPLAEARRSLGEVAAALATAHEQGIVHRDIKPANILYEEATGRSLVTDFGIAAVGPTADVKSMRLTGTGVIIGTPQYMSPEQLLAEPVSEKTDIYSLGLLAHELLLGSTPFRGSSPNELIAAHLRDTPARLAARRADVDPELDEIIARCLEKDAGKRPSADEVSRRLSPGGVALLEWPPPGLEKLHGKLRGLSARYWLGGSLVLAAVVPSVLVGSRLNAGIASPVSLLLSLLAIGGFLVLGGAVRRSVRLGRETSRAVRGGYGWVSVLETLADYAGDTGNIVSGSREYAALTPAQRTEYRRGRMKKESLLFGGGFLMVPLFMLVVVLGSMGYAPPETAWIAVVIPALAAIAAAVLEAREQRTFASRRQRPGSASEHDTAKLSGPWYESFEAVSRNQSLGRGSTRAPVAGWMAALAACAVVLMMIVLLVPVLLASTIGPTFWSIAFPKFSNTMDKLVMASVTRPFQVPRDPRIAPLEAGGAFYALQVDGSTQPRTAFAELPRPTPSLPVRPWQDSIPDSLFPTAKPDQVKGLPSATTIIEVAGRGLNPAQSEYLARVAAAEQWKPFSIVARAPRMDYFGARYVIPFADSAGGWWAFPIPRFARTKELAYAGVSRAAWHLSQGRRDSAEVALREVVSFGFTMVDNSWSLIEELIGTVIIGIGQHGLIQFYKVTGDPRGAAHQAQVDSVTAVIQDRRDNADSSGIDLADSQQLRHQMRAMLDDEKGSRGIRMEMLRLMAAAPCTNARELIFGNDRDVESSFAKARRTMARFPSDSAMIDLVERTPELLAGYGTPRGPSRLILGLATIEGALLGNPRVAGCARLFAQWGRD